MVSNDQRTLEQALWDVWAALGHDTDGDTGPGAWIAGSGIENFARTVVADAAEYRRECEEEMERQYAEAQAAEAKVARVEEALAVLDEVAYGQISVEKVLTILPTGPHRAQVPAHWADEAAGRARPFREHLRAALDGDA